MKDWRKTLINLDVPIIKAIEVIDASALQIAMVTDSGGHLLGVITDGNIRRALLHGISMEQPVETVMNRNFTSARMHTSDREILEIMRRKDLKQIPVLDEEGRVLNLKILEDLIQPLRRDNWVVLMAGGTGSRLQPLTNECPKPLLKIGNKPLLETILENFIGFGFETFFISVNYMAEMIKGLIGNGSRWGVNVHYLCEESKMGTAGALTLLPSRPEKPLIVMNADVLTNVNIQYLLDFHAAHQAKATMCVRDYHLQCPYGVITTKDHQLINIDEKPTQRFFVNAGVYVLEPDILDLIPSPTFFDMPELFQKAMARSYEVVAFPIREYWIDIGQIDDLKKADGDYFKNFK